MSKVTYDFYIDNIITVDAEVGTDPDTLIVKAKQKIIQQALNDQLIINFENTFDADSGKYNEKWEIEDE